MKITDFVASVDGGSVKVTEFLFHSQSDPFPGGHSYRVFTQERVLVDEVRKRVSSECCERLPAQTAHSVFGLLQSELTFIAGYVYDAKWMLNTIDAIVFENEGVTLTGVCSVLGPASQSKGPEKAPVR